MIYRLTYWIALLCTLPLTLHAQSTEADLKARLMNKPLYLRGCWRDDTLHFDPTGHLLGTSTPVTFTLCGFDLNKVQLNQDKLILDGKRIGLQLANNQQKRVPLHRMHIEIATNTSGDFGPSLDAIFVDGLADLVPTMPSYWKAYAQKTFLPPGGAIPATPSQIPSIQSGKPLKIGGNVKPPKLLHSAEPMFSGPARELGYTGSTVINLWLKPDGTTTRLSVVRALGLGLDECALIAIQQYVFAPAVQDGKPVLVELNVEVNFY